MSDILNLIQEVENNSQAFHNKIQSMRLSQMFYQIKLLIKKCDQQKIFNVIYQSSYKKLALILEFIVRKLSRRRKYQIKEYVGLISLLSLIFSARQFVKWPVDFQKQFYSNQLYYAKKILAYFNTSQGLQLQNQKRRLLATYLFSLCSFCQNNSKTQGINMDEFLSTQVIKVILKIDLPDQYILMKYFQIIAIYIYKNKSKTLPTSILLKPLLKYFMLCTSNKNAQGTFLLLLNRLILNKRIVQSRIFKTYEVSLIQKLKLVVFNENNFQIYKLSASLLGRILKNNIGLSYKLISSQKLIDLINKQKELNWRIQNTRAIIMAAIYGMEDGEKYELFKMLRDHIKRMQLIALQVLEYLTRIPNSQILVSLIEDGLLNNFIDLAYHDNGIEYNKSHLIFQIVDNVVFNSLQINKEAVAIIKNQLNLKSIALNCVQNSFSFY